MEQLEFDLRIKDEKDIEDSIIKLIENTVQTNLVNNQAIKNKHEAYGIVAEHLATINGINKSLKSDVGSLLNLLPIQGSSNADMLNTISAIYVTTTKLIKSAVIMSTFCRKITEDIYVAEAEDFPLGEFAEENDPDFEEAGEIDEEE